MTDRFPNHQVSQSALPCRNQTFEWAQHVMTMALQLESSRSVPLNAGTSLKLVTPELRKTICEDAVSFLDSLTLEEGRVPASAMLDRLSLYLFNPITEIDYYFFQHPEAVYCVCFILLLYEKAQSDFYDYFPDDEEIIVELAMAADAVTSLLRFLNNGRMPGLTRLRSAAPRLAELCESLRRMEI